MSDWLTGRAQWDALRQRVRRATRHREAEDLLQAAVLRWLERDIQGVDDPDAYIVRSACNLACDEARRERRRALVPRSGDTLQAIMDVSPQPDAVAISRQRLERLHIACGELAPRTREIFLLHRLDGLRYEDIARQVGISVSAVEKHVSKAVRILTERTGD